MQVQKRSDIKFDDDACIQTHSHLHNYNVLAIVVKKQIVPNIVRFIRI